VELLELALEELGAIVDVKQEADTESVLGTTEERWLWKPKSAPTVERRHS